KLTPAGNQLFFTAQQTATGRELWVTDGTAAGTHLVRDIAAGSAWSYLEGLTSLGSTVLFSASDGVSGVDLWRSDGTAAGTFALPATPATYIAGNLSVFGSRVLYQGTTGTIGAELFASDGTAAGTTLVADLNTSGGDTAIAQLLPLGDRL